MSYPRRRILLGAVSVLGAPALLAACSNTPEDRRNTEEQAHIALRELQSRVPGTQQLAANAKGVLVFPSVTQAAFIFGGQGGRGIMLKNGRPAGLYNVTGGSFGLQIGAQNFSQAYFFMTQQALDTFENTRGFELGAGVDFAVADVGTSGAISTSSLQKPLLVFVWGQTGLIAGVNVNGQKVTRLAES